MVEILQNKNSATRFQILVEIAASGPAIQQKSIAAKLGFTPQAISDYIHLHLGSLPSLPSRFVENCQQLKDSDNGKGTL